jgi:hypothetical protein
MFSEYTEPRDSGPRAVTGSATDMVPIPLDHSRKRLLTQLILTRPLSLLVSRPRIESGVSEEGNGESGPQDFPVEIKSVDIRFDLGSSRWNCAEEMPLRTIT